MVIPDTFGIRGERVVASYDFIDFIEGTGVITYYSGSGLNDSATEEFILKSNTFYSNTIFVEGAITNTAWAIAFEKNYDLSPLNLPLTIKGTASVIISWAVFGHGSTTMDGYLKSKLIKVSDAGETIIGTGKTGEINIVTSAAWEETTSTMILNLTQTHFKIGDTIRLSIEGWARTGQGGQNGKIGWGQDPINRDSAPLTPSTDDTITKTNITIPFQINL